MNKSGHSHHGSRRISLQLLSLRMTVTCEEPGLADALTWFFGQFIGDPEADATVTIDIRADPSAPEDLVYLRNSVVTRKGPARRILRHALWDIHGSVLEDTDEFLFIHASAVSRGRGLLLPGGEEAGKSTTAAALLLRGWSYLSDELGVLPLDGDDLLTPFPKVLTLMPDAIAHLSGLEGRLTDRSEGWPDLPDRYVRADQLGATTSEPARVGWIAFLDPNRSGPARLDPVGRAQSLQLLVRHCLNLAQHKGRAIARLSGIAEEAASFVLTGGTPKERAAVLSDLVKE